MPNGTSDAMGTALAGGAIAAALLEVLYDKGLLTLEDSRSVLDRAAHGLTPVIHSPGGFDAARVIGDLQRGKFSAR